MAEFKITFKPGLSVLIRRFKNAFKTVGQLNVVHKKIAVFLDIWVLRNFKSEGGKVGGWTPFKIGGRRKPGGKIDTSAKLLQDTGRLRASFNSVFDKDNVTIGSDLDYSEFHEKGMGHLPVRRMLPEIGEVGGDIFKIFDKHVRDGLKKAKGQ